MPVRLLPALLLFFLAGCVTTGNGKTETAQPAAEVPVVEQTAPSSVATIDDHLYEPPALAAPAGSPVPHVHDSVWERLAHSFDLPDCASHEQNLQWAQWYAERPDYMERIFKRAEP